MSISELKSPKAHGCGSSLGLQGVTPLSNPFSPALDGSHTTKHEAEESRMMKINELIDQSAHELAQMMDKRNKFYRDWGCADNNNLQQLKSMKRSTA